MVLCVKGTPGKTKRLPAIDFISQVYAWSSNSLVQITKNTLLPTAAPPSTAERKKQGASSQDSNTSSSSSSSSSSAALIRSTGDSEFDFDDLVAGEEGGQGGSAQTAQTGVDNKAHAHGEEEKSAEVDLSEVKMDENTEVQLMQYRAISSYSSLLLGCLLAHYGEEKVTATESEEINSKNAKQNSIPIPPNLPGFMKHIPGGVKALVTELKEFLVLQSDANMLTQDALESIMEIIDRLGKLSKLKLAE